MVLLIDRSLYPLHDATHQMLNTIPSDTLATSDVSLLLVVSSSVPASPPSQSRHNTAPASPAEMLSPGTRSKNANQAGFVDFGCTPPTPGLPDLVLAADLSTSKSVSKSLLSTMLFPHPLLPRALKTATATGEYAGTISHSALASTPRRLRNSSIFDLGRLALHPDPRAR